MDYLALVIRGIITPFITLGEMISWIGKKYWNWIISGIKEANDEEDWALSTAYWLIHIIVAAMFGALPLLLLLLKSETAIILGIVFALAGGIINIGVFCILLHGEIYSRQQ